MRVGPSGGEHDSPLTLPWDPLATNDIPCGLTIRQRWRTRRRGHAADELEVQAEVAQAEASRQPLELEVEGDLVGIAAVDILVEEGEEVAVPALTGALGR